MNGDEWCRRPAKCILMLVPVNRPSDVVSVAAPIGTVVMRDPELTTVLRSWEERFGVIVTRIGPGMLDVFVGAPPTRLGQARRLAGEVRLFAPDTTDVYKHPEQLPKKFRWGFGWPDVGLRDDPLRQARGPDRPTARSRSTPRPSRAALAEGPLTATDAFYVRGHGPVPEFDPAAWRLRVARARRARAGPLLSDAARGVPRARGHRDAAVRRQPPRGPDRRPRHPRPGALGPGRDRHGDLERGRARRRACARRPATRGRARGLPGRRGGYPQGKQGFGGSTRWRRRAARRFCSPTR